MTLTPLDIVLLLVALAAIGFAVWRSQQGGPDLIRLTSERDERAREADSLRQERDQLRGRAEAAEQQETAARTKLGAVEENLTSERNQNHELRRDLSGLREEHRKIEGEVAAVRERSKFADEALNSMKEAFALQSSEAMRQALTDLREVEAKNREQREELERQALGRQLKPVADTLERFEKHVIEMEQKRASDVGGLNSQIESLMKASVATQLEARKLSTALRRGAGVQGRWGEQTLRNVLELAGLASRFDFEEQFHVAGETTLRPDVVVRLPGGGLFVVDAKCSLTAYLESLDAVDDAAREASLIRHAASVRTHLSSLSAKAYWDQFKKEKSPDFVAMFIPGDSFLAAALDRAPDLMTEAMDKRVLLVTPTILFGLCKAVAYGWRVEEQSHNAEEVAKLGKELYKRLSVMGGHVEGIGKALEGAVGKYNSFVGSLEGQVLTQARKFEELKVDHEGKEIPELLPLEVGVRPLAKLISNQSLKVGGEGS